MNTKITIFFSPLLFIIVCLSRYFPIQTVLNQYSTEGKMDEKKSNSNQGRKQADESEISSGVTEKMLAMHNALDDGYGSSNSSPHSAGKYQTLYFF